MVLKWLGKVGAVLLVASGSGSSLVEGAGIITSGGLVDLENLTRGIRILNRMGDNAKFFVKFLEQNPDYQISYDFTRHDDYAKEDLDCVITMRNPPDVVGWYSGGESVREHIKNGKLHDLDSLYTKFGLYDQIPKSFLAGVSDEQGHPYAVPTDFNHYAIHYNLNTFAEHGLTIPSGDDWKWEEFLSICEEAKQAGLIPISIGLDGENPWPLGAWFDYLNMRINGPEFHINLTAGYEKYNGEKVKKVFEAWTELLDKGYLPNRTVAMEGDWFKQRTDLVDDKNCAFTLMADFIRYYPAYQPEIRFVRFPIMDESKKIGEDAPVDGFMIPKNARNIDGAEKVLAYIGGVDFQLERLIQTYAMPVNSLLKSAHPDPLKLQAAEMLESADYILQYYDRDTVKSMADLGLQGMKAFYFDPSQIDTILDGLELKRQEIYLGLASECVFSIPSGTFKTNITFNITTPTEGASIFYTLDGSRPSSESEMYEGPINLQFHGRHTVRAVAVKEGLKNSKVKQVVYDVILFEEKRISIEGAAVIGRIFGIVGITFTAIIMGFTYKHRKTPVFAATQPLFVQIMLFGSILAMCSTFTMSLDLDQPGVTEEQVSMNCMVTPWLISVGFALTFGALLSKTYRIFKIFGNKKMKKVAITNKQLLGAVVGYTFVEVLFMTIWQVVDPQHLVKVNQSEWVYFMACKSDNPYWSTVAILIKFFAVFVAIIMCILTRNVTSAFNESKQIGFGIYNLAFIGGASLGLSFAMTEMNIVHIVRCAGLVMTCLCLTVTIVAPKLYIVYFAPHLNTFGIGSSTTGNTGNTSNRTNNNTSKVNPTS